MAWWHRAVFYQIYPRSFLDTDGDGVGDLAGIRKRLDYLFELGVDALWLSPIYPSPMRDFGYDVADYCDVDPVFGSLADFDLLLAEAHERGLRVIIDWVPNHTSSDHPWFLDARTSRTSAHRDWYIWRDATADGGPPNNWVRNWSVGPQPEPAWTFDDLTEQYYLHCFLPGQPDLNWSNVAVRSAMADTLRFWLDRGVDGFRMDVIHLIGKADGLPDDPEELRALGRVPLNDVPVTHEYLREIRGVLDAREGDPVSVGEVYLLDPERVVDYYGHGDELHLSFNFTPMMTPWRAERWCELIVRNEGYHRARDAWPTWVLSNHDNPRVATRLKGDAQRTRAAAVLLATLRGTPFLYAGEELGLRDADIPPERVVDPGGRDGCRAPIPWTSEPGHGWTGAPWLPFAANAESLAAEVQGRDPASLLNFWRSLLALRRSSPALLHGDLTAVRAREDVLSFERRAGDEVIDVCVSFSHEQRLVAVAPSARVMLSGTGRAQSSGGQLTLAGGEPVILVRTLTGGSATPPLN
jgi:alpha-glucosidase